MISMLKMITPNKLIAYQIVDAKMMKISAHLVQLDCTQQQQQQHTPAPKNNRYN